MKRLSFHRPTNPEKNHNPEFCPFSALLIPYACKAHQHSLASNQILKQSLPKTPCMQPIHDNVLPRATKKEESRECKRHSAKPHIQTDNLT